MILGQDESYKCLASVPTFQDPKIHGKNLVFDSRPDTHANLMFQLLVSYDLLLPYPDEKVPPPGFLVITRDHGH